MAAFGLLAGFSAGGPHHRPANRRGDSFYHQGCDCHDVVPFDGRNRAGYLAHAERVVAQQSGVKELRRLRMRWMGHRIGADVCIAVDPYLTTVDSHHIAEHLRHDLFHEVPYLAEVTVVDSWSEEPSAHHELTHHHDPVPQPVLA